MLVNSSADSINYCITKSIVVLDTYDPVDYIASNSWNVDPSINNISRSYQDVDYQILKSENITESTITDNNGLKLEPIYFNFDKFNLRTDALKTIKKNANILDSK